MGKVGNDEFGRIVLNRLRAYGVEEGSMIVSLGQRHLLLRRHRPAGHRPDLSA